MDPLPNSLFAAPCHRSDDSPSSSEDRKRDEHRTETYKASSFREAMKRRNGAAATTGKQTPAGGAGKLIAGSAGGARSRSFEQSLSPSLMKLREQGGQVSEEQVPIAGGEGSAHAEPCESSTEGSAGGEVPP